MDGVEAGFPHRDGDNAGLRAGQEQPRDSVQIFALTVRALRDLLVLKRVDPAVVAHEPLPEIQVLAGHAVDVPMLRRQLLKLPCYSLGPGHDVHVGLVDGLHLVLLLVHHVPVELHGLAEVEELPSEAGDLLVGLVAPVDLHVGGRDRTV